MANKFKPGIPDGFTFDVAPVADLGDYLDERGPSPSVAKQGREVPPAPRRHVRTTPPVRTSIEMEPPVAVEPIVPEAVIAANTDSRPEPFREPTPPVAVDAPPRIERPRAPRHTGPRREVNMSSEALRMSDELLDLIRNGSGQRDTKANELIHAIILLAFEVKDELDPHSIPKRGRWGSPTARAYPLEIKNAILRALLKKYQGAVESAGV